MSSLIPDELLSKWLLFVSSLAILNCTQNFIDHQFSRKVYTRAGADITPLSARTFGVWNFTSAIIRVYAAYNIHDRVAYQICMWSFAIALVHFTSELLAFKTARLSAGIVSPLVVASLSLTTMFFRYSDYIH